MMNSKVSQLFEDEIKQALVSEKANDIAKAWAHLAQAHILGQFFVLPHLRVHWVMFKLGLRTLNKNEILGQIPRLILAAPGSFFKKVPKGNTGLSSVGIFEPMAIPEDLEDALNAETKPSHS